MFVFFEKILHPLSVWEAMSMEKAIVSTDVGDIKKFINNGNNGLVVHHIK